MRKPFFARFLEIQELDSVVGGGKGGGGKVTLRYPSDDDVFETERRVSMRYPSDEDHPGP